MSHKKMLQCSMGALLLLLPWFGGLVLGEISKNFSQCLDFFYKKTPPTGILAEGYQPICQRYKGKYSFATLYHRQRRSPLYSAYKLSAPDGKRPNQAWMFEPQLACSGAKPDMKIFSNRVDQNVIESQAVNEDYKNSGFTRGHLNPSGHHKTEQDRNATFTLTNIVPQREGSNNGPWNNLEKKLLETAKLCTKAMHVITGVLPYGSALRNPKEHMMKGRVSIPEYMWSAYCCPSTRSKQKNLNDQNAFFHTYAALGRNDRNSGEEFVPINVNAKEKERGYDVKRMPLAKLEKILSKRLGRTITLFKGQCKQKMSL